MSGYQGGKPTEFLVLVNWYMDQARELEALAGRGEGKPFDTPYASTKVPVLYKSSDWVQNKKNANRGVVDSILRDPDLARLYWAMSRMDTETGRFLWESLGPKKFILGAPVLDFYGSQISIRAGRILVPGGATSENAWKDLVGVSPRSAADFVSRLLVKDGGWLASYFDTLSRVSQAQQAYFTTPRRLPRFYEALRGHEITPIPTKHSFRPDPGLFFLEARLQI